MKNVRQLCRDPKGLLYSYLVLNRWSSWIWCYCEALLGYICHSYHFCFHWVILWRQLVWFRIDQVYGDEEWSFGFCEDGTGVFSCPSRKNPMYTFRESIVLGRTNCSIFKVNQIIRELSREWPGYTYDLLSRNCNHFCDEFSERLGLPKLPGKSCSPSSSYLFETHGSIWLRSPCWLVFLMCHAICGMHWESFSFD